MNIKRMIFGEKMPDKDDPKYKERYEREVKAGRKFAETLHIDKFAASIQRFADRHRTAFLVIVFGFVVGSFAWNIYRLAVVYNHKPNQRTATEMQDSLLRERHKALEHHKEKVDREREQEVEPINRQGNEDNGEDKLSAAEVYVTCHTLLSPIGSIVFHL